MTDQNEKRPNPRKIREGLVVSTSMDKTAVVAIVDRVRHRRYNKTVQRTKNFSFMILTMILMSETGSASKNSAVIEEEAMENSRDTGSVPDDTTRVTS